jgi:hypothetical protein
MVQGDPQPLLAVPGLCNNCLSSLVFSLEKEGNVMEPLVVKNIVGKNHRAYVIDNESRLFHDLSLAACFE